jgi:hypothetical protein
MNYTPMQHHESGEFGILRYPDNEKPKQVDGWRFMGWGEAVEIAKSR